MTEVYPVFMKKSVMWIWKKFFVILCNRNIFAELVIFI